MDRMVVGDLDIFDFHDKIQILNKQKTLCLNLNSLGYVSLCTYYSEDYHNYICQKNIYSEMYDNLGCGKFHKLD